MIDKPKTGGNVDAFCTKCKMELAHTVVAMVDERVVKAKCNTCHAFHRYRRAPGAKKAARANGKPATRAAGTRAKKTAASKAAASAASWELQWQQQVDQAGEKAIVAYRMTDAFDSGDVIQHKRFGIGVVQQVVESQKMTALFRSGMRTLVMNR